MTRPVKLVVRKNKKTGIYESGFASHLPLSKYIHIASFGEWFGSQMNYAPFKKAKKEASEFAKKKNKK